MATFPGFPKLSKSKHNVTPKQPCYLGSCFAIYQQKPIGDSTGQSSRRTRRCKAALYINCNTITVPMYYTILVPLEVIPYYQTGRASSLATTRCECRAALPTTSRQSVHQIALETCAEHRVPLLCTVCISNLFGTAQCSLLHKSLGTIKGLPIPEHLSIAAL